VLTTATLATSSLAWFAVGNTTYVQNIQVGYAGDDFSLRIVKDGQNYQNDQSKYSFSDPLSFKAVTTMFPESWYGESSDPESDTPRFLRGEYASADYTIEKDTAKENDGYYSFEFFLTCNQDCYVYLDKTSSISVNHDMNFLYAQAEAKAAEKNPTLQELEDRAEELDRAVNAARISFFSNMGYQIVDPNKENGKDVPFAGPLDVYYTDGYYDYDPQTKKERVYGDYDPAILDEIPYRLIEEDNPPMSGENCFEAALKKGTYGFDREDFLEEFSDRIAHEPGYSLEEFCFENDTSDIEHGSHFKGKSHPICFIPANQTERVVVSLYVEGWDPDCINASDCASFQFNLSFDGFYCQEGVAGTPKRVFAK
ncbi:MAG: hypothetical protein J5736_01295, partial [Bacilli bacterium]|nr:hypothetical protein [Bacilli bacterium]